MSNIVEYTLSLNDKLSSKLKKIGIANDVQLAKWSQVERRVRSAERTMSQCGISIGSLRERVSALRAEKEWIPASNIQAIKRTNSEIFALEKQISKLHNATTCGKFSSAIKSAFDSIPFSNLITNPVVLAGSAAFSAIKKGFEKEKVEIAFDVLIGDKGKSSNLLKQIQKFGAATPYQTNDLQDEASMMLSFGIDPRKIMPNLKMLGDVAMGDKEKMKSLTLAFSQMSSTGKLTGQDLLQMINAAGFNPLTELSRMTGKSMAELKEDMSKGLISSKMIEKAFVSATSAGGRFYKMTEKMGQSNGGKWSTILDKGVQRLWQLYDIIQPLINPALSLMSKTLDFIGVVLKGFRSIVTKTGDALTWYFSLLAKGNFVTILITGAIMGLAGALTILKVKAMLMASWAGIVTSVKLAWAAAQNFLNASMLTSPITWIIAGIISLIAVLGYVIYKTKGWGTVWEGVIGFMKYTLYAFVDGVKLYYDSMITALMVGLDKIKIGWYKFKNAVGLGDKEENDKAIDAINAGIEARQKAIIDGAESAVANLKKAKSALAGIDLKWDSNKSLSGFMSGMKEKLGISSPSIPGLHNTTAEVNATDGSSSAAIEASSAITTGGKRVQNTTINVDKLVERIIFDGSFDENSTDLEDKITNALIRVLMMAKTAQ